MAGMDDSQEATHADREEIESLRVTVATLGREVQSLAEKVSALTRAVEGLTPPSPAPQAAATREKPGPESSAARDFSVVITPLPELAMAAVAETSLRGLESVRQVLGVKRTGEEARFTLQVDRDGDLIEEMRGAMPVEFEVISSAGDEVVIDLQWAWGRPPSAREA